MIVSLNEIESIVLKAARGAGMSWGLAEEAAQAARWFAICRCGWEHSLVRLLAHRDDISPPVLDGQLVVPAKRGFSICPIHAGAALADLLPVHGRLTLRDVREPRWLLPFAAGCAHSEAPLVLSCADTTVRATPTGLLNSEVLCAERLAAITIEISPAAPVGRQLAPTPPPDGVPVDPACWQRLDSFAARTYVPASAQSRMGGAGAGLLDND